METPWKKPTHENSWSIVADLGTAHYLDMQRYTEKCDNRKAGRKERQGNAETEDGRSPDIMAEWNRCIGNEQRIAENEAIDKHCDQCHVTWTLVLVLKITINT